MNLFKVSFYNGISVLIKMLTMLGLNKVLAVYVGPGGYAIIGQYQSFVQTLSTFSAGALSNGITKYTTQHVNDCSKLYHSWITAGTLSIISSVSVSILILISFSRVNEYFFNSTLEHSISYWLAASFIFMMLNNFLMAILNGLKEIKVYILLNIISSFVSLCFTGTLSYIWGLKGALIALTVNQSICFIFTLFFCMKQHWFKFKIFFGEIDLTVLHGLARFALMALISSFAVPLTQIYLRSFIGNNISWAISGYWEAMNRISGINIMLATTTLTIYFLPKLTEITNKAQLKHELFHVGRLLLPLAFIGCIFVFLFRNNIIYLLFSSSFIEMRSLFGWQLAGDFFKILSWLFSFTLLAKEKWKPFLLCELVSSFSLILSTKVIIQYFSWTNLSFAYFITYIIYTMMTFLLFYAYVYKKAV